jgi:hypothetical protein
MGFVLPSDGASEDLKATITAILILASIALMILAVYVFTSWRERRRQRVRGKAFRKLEFLTFVAGGETEECGICLEEYAGGDKIAVVPCAHRHRYHVLCIRRWLMEGTSATCPICREIV